MSLQVALAEAGLRPPGVLGLQERLLPAVLSPSSSLASLSNTANSSSLGPVGLAGLQEGLPVQGHLLDTLKPQAKNAGPGELLHALAEEASGRKAWRFY